MAPYMIAAFYKFVPLTQLVPLQASIQQICIEQGILGTILLAAEGINGTVAGSIKNVAVLIEYLRTQTDLETLECKYSYSDFIPFHKTKILIKKEIVTMGLPDICPNQKTGILVSPEKWNNIISNNDTIVIDTRNNYEIELGTFKGALNPSTEKFSDFPDFVEKHLDNHKHKKIAVFCTGGIRCEKASAYLLEKGFENVYQLEGGILKYLEKIPEENSLWQGKCFIFDNRVVLEKESIKAE